MRILKVMNYLMKKHIFFVALALLMGIFTIMSNVGMLATSSVLISKAALHPDVLDLMVLIVAVRFFGISRGVFRYLERLLSHDTTFRILSSMRRWFYKNFNEHYSENNKNFKTGDIYTKLVNDVDTLKEFFLRGIYPLITAVLTGIITSIFISYFNKKAAIIYILIYIVSGFIIPVILYEFNKGYIERESEIKKELNLLIIDIVKGIVETSIFSLKEQFSLEFNRLSFEYLSIQKRKNLIAVIGDSLYSLSVSLVIISSLLIMAPAVSFGLLEGVYYAMIPLAAMASFEALMPMPNILYKFKEANNAGTNIFSIIDSSDIKEDECNKADKFDLTVKDLEVYEEGGENSIIKNISFNLPYGKKIAIVGASGSGKSSVLRTLLGFMKYEHGKIELGGVPYSKIDKEELRKSFTYVDQNPYLFNTTIKENLLIANGDVNEEEIIKKLKDMQLEQFVSDLSDGLDTMLGEFGSNYSGGEKQRLALTRAMLKKSKIVLLDEATASLDIKLERKIIEEIHEEIENKSCVWVTHRLVSMEKFDEILVMDKGQIIERGTHEELINIKGSYYKLWNIQQQYITELNSFK